MSAVVSLDSYRRDVQITRFASLTNPHGTLQAVPWEQFVDMLREPRPRPADPEKPQLPGWSPATFREAHRKQENVVEVTALALDFDKGAPSLDDVRAALDGLRAVVHCTRRSTPSAPRWRATVAVSRAMTPDEHAIIWAHLRDRCASRGVVVDEQTKDASRFWYLPCEPAEGAYIFAELAGEALDVDAIIASARSRNYTPSSASSTQPAATATTTPSSPIRVDEPDELARITSSTREKRATAYAATCEAAVEGDRGSNVAMRVVVDVVRGFALGDSAEARQALASWNARCEPPWPTQQLDHKIADAMRVGRMVWGEILLRGDSERKRSSETATEQSRPTPACGVEIREVLARWAHEGPVVRQPTGIHALDAATMGGVAFGDTWIVAGSPDAAKTALIVQIADTMAAAGCVVGLLAADAASGADSVVLRLAQRRGYGRRRVEDRSGDTLNALADSMAELPVIIYDGNVSIEDAAADVARRAAELGARGALFVDSVHAARSSSEQPDKPMRDVIGARVRSLVTRGVEHRLATIATAEMARSTYAAPDDARADAAAGAETRVLDYVPAAKLVARRCDEDGCYSLALVRSKSGGSGTTIYLALDRERMVLSPTAPPPPKPSVEDRRATREERRRCQDDEDDAAALAVIAANPDATVRDLVALVRKARGCGGDRAHASVVRARRST